MLRKLLLNPLPAPALCRLSIEALCRQRSAVLYRKLLALAVFFLPLSAQAADAIYHTDTTGLTLTVQVRTTSAATITASMSELPAGSGFYVVTDATLVTATMPAPTSTTTYPYVVKNGSTVVGQGSLSWKGTAAVPASAAFLDLARSSFAVASSVGEFVNSLFTALPDGGDQIMGEDGAVSLTDVDQENVPTSRVFVLVRDEDGGLIAEKAKGIKVGENNTFAVDFRNDMPVNGKINIVEPPTISEGTAGGITFDEDDLGRDKSLAKHRPVGVTPGEYSVEIEVQYDSGATAIGTIHYTVAP